MGKEKSVRSLIFDPKERVDFVKGFGKRKQERKELAKQKALEKERQLRSLMRQKRREALKKARGETTTNEEQAIVDSEPCSKAVSKVSSETVA